MRKEIWATASAALLFAEACTGGGHDAEPTTTFPTETTAEASNTTEGTVPYITDAEVVYYQPRLSDLHNPSSTEVPSGVLTMLAEPGKPDSWTIGDCAPGNADDFEKRQANIKTLVGFSLGRVGIPYFLEVATDKQKSEIDSVVIVAPGDTFDFTDSCDPENTGALVRDWLEIEKSKHLTVVADARTAEEDYAGIKNLYLKDLAGTSVADQVTVCQVEQGGHEDTWNSTKAKIVEDPTACPTGSEQYNGWK